VVLESVRVPEPVLALAPVQAQVQVLEQVWHKLPRVVLLMLKSNPKLLTFVSSLPPD
jgi:hypothetical protein